MRDISHFEYSYIIRPRTSDFIQWEIEKHETDQSCQRMNLAASLFEICHSPKYLFFLIVFSGNLPLSPTPHKLHISRKGGWRWMWNTFS